MTRGRGNIFDNEKILHEMLALRAKGLGLSELGRKYGVDHSTIFYHIKKSGMATVQRVVQKPKDVVKPRISVEVIQFSYIDFRGEPINPGKDYKEYLEECEKRRWEELLKGGRNKK